MAKLLWFSLNEIKTLMFAVFAFESNGNHRVLIREHFRSFSLTSKRESLLSGRRYFRNSTVLLTNSEPGRLVEKFAVKESCTLARLHTFEDIRLGFPPNVVFIIWVLLISFGSFVVCIV